MKKRVVVISSSLRYGSNSEILARAVLDGAASTGSETVWISLKDKNLGFCKGCLACQSTGKCMIQDDMNNVIGEIKDADVIVLATPVYYYGMSGQLKTFLDRCNPLYVSDYKFRDVYLLTTSAEDGEEVYKTTEAGVQGWIDCFPKAKLAGIISGGGVNNPKEINFHKELIERAYTLGKNIGGNV